jgi:hypothetical protein
MPDIERCNCGDDWRRCDCSCAPTENPQFIGEYAAGQLAEGDVAAPWMYPETDIQCYRSVPWLYADGKLEDVLRHDLLYVLNDHRATSLIWRRRETFDGDVYWFAAMLPGIHHVTVERIPCVAYVWHRMVDVGFSGEIRNLHETSGHVMMLDDSEAIANAAEIQAQHNARALPLLNAATGEERRALDRAAYLADILSDTN